MPNGQVGGAAACRRQPVADAVVARQALARLLRRFDQLRVAIDPSRTSEQPRPTARLTGIAHRARVSRPVGPRVAEIVRYLPLQPRRSRATMASVSHPQSRDRGLPGRPAARRGRAGRGVPHRRPTGAGRLRGRGGCARAGSAQSVCREPRAWIRRSTSVRGPIDTLVVAGGTGVVALEARRSLPRGPARAAARSRRVAGVCTGAFLLAAAGLLDGRRATTHWASCALLAERHPETQVDPDPIFVRDGNVYTSAGVTAGMDLALGTGGGGPRPRDGARPRRAGSSCSSSARAARRSSAPSSTRSTADRRPLRELQAWIADNVDADLSVPALAERAHMSERNFARAFGREVGMTPATFVECARVESARMALEAGDAPVETVAARAGFGTVETMRRAFHRRVGVGPADYRRRFRSEQRPERSPHADRDPALRPLHRPRRRRPLRGALAGAGRHRDLRRRGGAPVHDRHRDAHHPRRRGAGRHPEPRGVRGARRPRQHGRRPRTRP